MREFSFSRQVFYVSFILSFLFISCDERDKVNTTTEKNEFRKVDSRVKLKERKILAGKFKILIPADFYFRNKAFIKKHYVRGNKPKEVYSAEYNKASMAVNYSFNADIEKRLPSIFSFFEQQLSNTYSEIKWLNKSLENGSIKLEFMNSSSDGMKYNLMGIYPHGKDMLVVNFTCLSSEMNTWKDPANEIINRGYFY